ncbi:tail fiber domain-containing protein [Ichthyenterobacterium magnum]|uniref:Endosialidase-like protein n=1 Tax=Ichthyenterobacterium magnum TaxID=1230530 RepID=A0A420DGS7_9FLAO|nr:tail fiber domain-containing protein [Ichthyenterobacterium magnum]RKE92280.1 endosialidase-like protein [Ichthyenterobacterium magnum]
MKQLLLFIKLNITVLFILLGAFSFAQEGINYQGVARNAEGELILDTEITLDININKISADGETVYSETHNLFTDANGVFSLVIGQGTPSLNLFEDINWAEDQHFLNVWLDGEEIGTTQFSSVPYSQAVGKWQAHKNGVTSKSTGGSIYIGESAGELDDFTDNHNIGIGKNAIMRNTTGESNIALGKEALKFSSEGIRNIAIGEQTMENNSSGSNNIAIGNKAMRESGTGNHNIAMGYKSLYSNSTGLLNHAYGHETLYYNTTGSYNIATGYQSLYSNTEGEYNTAFGYQALLHNTTGNNNIANGAYALYGNTIGEYNIALGRSALAINTEGSYNIAIGKSTLESVSNGILNIALGLNTLSDVQTGDNNIAIGRNAGANNVSGNNNVFLGSFAGWSETSSNKLYIGSYVSEGHTPLIYGEFDDAILNFNAKVAVGTRFPKAPLHVVNGTDANLSNYSGQLLLGEVDSDNLVLDKNEIQARSNGAASILFLQQNGGDVYVGNAVVHASDRRLKRDINDISYGLNEILQLRPTEYFWKERTQEHKSLGLIAQEVDQVIKNVVTYDEKQDKYGVSYTELIPVLIKALQEQQEIIEHLQSNQKNQQDIISELKAEVNTLKTSK